MQEILKDIRTQCRLAMNGVASTSMRERGLNYKINFGLVIGQIRDLASNYSASKELAETLWAEDTRELKILATLLYPIGEFWEETANKWVAQIPNQEIREQVCLNLFQELPFASNIAIEWSSKDDEEMRTTGYWLLARLSLSKKLNEELAADLFPFVWEDAISNDIFLRNAALSVLKYIGRQSKDTANRILDKLATYKNSEDILKQEAYNSLLFEFEYFYEN